MKTTALLIFLIPTMLVANDYKLSRGRTGVDQAAKSLESGEMESSDLPEITMALSIILTTSTCEMASAQSMKKIATDTLNAEDSFKRDIDDLNEEFKRIIEEMKSNMTHEVSIEASNKVKEFHEKIAELLERRRDAHKKAANMYKMTVGLAAIEAKNNGGICEEKGQYTPDLKRMGDKLGVKSEITKVAAASMREKNSTASGRAFMATLLVGGESELVKTLDNWIIQHKKYAGQIAESTEKVEKAEKKEEPEHETLTF